MYQDINLVVSPEQHANTNALKELVAHYLHVDPKRVKHIQLLQRSLDARQRKVRFNLQIRVYLDSISKDEDAYVPRVYPNVSNRKPVIVVGAGPGGIFAALRLLEMNLRPIIVERGKDVHNRKRDIAQLHRTQDVNPDSNYSFGEGGAGTFSDGKLYTRSKKRGDVRKIIEVLHQHGANEDILIDSHPHIGTDKLPGIMRNLRQTIIESGGTYLFDKRVIDIIIKDGKACGVKTHDGDEIVGEAVILATGHSSREIFELLQSKGLAMEAKPFALGVRVEHPQAMIDSIQYHCDVRGPLLPSATYSLVHQVEGRGVYSFCMCPGGFIVPAATAPGEIVVNGMSPSHRNAKFANSGIVAEVKLEDLGEFHQYGALASLKFQHHVEQLAFRNGGGGQIAPAQRMVDFVKGKLSSNLPDSSYTSGLISSPLHFWLPSFIGTRLQEAFKNFGKQKYGYVSNEAVLVGVESRTSSPIKILRDPETLMHVQLPGLFPCGEGAGYAGGIVSSAIDGDNAAAHTAKWLAY